MRKKGRRGRTRERGKRGLSQIDKELSLDREETEVANRKMGKPGVR